MATEEKIDLNINITYNGIIYEIDLYRKDQEAWIHIRRDTFNNAMNDLRDAIKDAPELFIAIGEIDK